MISLSKDARLPVQLQRAMAAEAEAAREARAKVITNMIILMVVINMMVLMVMVGVEAARERGFGHASHGNGDGHDAGLDISG